VISEDVVKDFLVPSFLLEQETGRLNNLNSGRLLYERQVNNIATVLPKLFFN
jgi:hypothetical protein